MVYEGKPSQGCGTCRKRRIRCDQQRPTCGQCIKSKRECLGYRDQTELMFVNLNKSLQAKAAGKKQQQQQQQGSLSRGSTSDNEESSVVSVPQPLSETVERQALTYFFSEFVMLPRHQDATRGFMEYLLPIYADAGKGSSLFDATSAAALASLSRRRKSSRLMVHSHIYYGKAVTALQEAIADTTLARSNETLMSILVLGMFEAMTASDQSLFEWGHHADGAAALVQYRGREEMLADPLSSKMYWFVRSHSVFSNIIKNEPLEPHLDWENLWAAPLDMLPDTHGVKLTALSTRIPALRAAAHKWLHCPMSGAVAVKCIDIVGNAKVIDQLLAAWAFEAPSIWRPRIVGSVEGVITDPDATFLFPGDMVSYHDLWVCNIWNTWRTMRIVLNMLVINSLERLLPPTQLLQCPEYQCATTIIQNMADGVCASVPYHFGHPMPQFDEVEFLRHRETTQMSLDDNDQPRYRAEPEDTERSVKTIGAYYLILPLFFAYSTPTLPDIQRAWLRGRLAYIGSHYGSGQAQVLADLSPTSTAGGRVGTVSDFAPPAYQPYPDIFELVNAPSFRNLEAIAELQASTAEARVFRAWRQGFIERLLDIDLWRAPIHAWEEDQTASAPRTRKRKRTDRDVGEGRSNMLSTGEPSF